MDIFVSLMVLLTAITPTTLRVARGQLVSSQSPGATTTTVTAAPAAKPVSDYRCQQCDLAAADLSGQDHSRKNFREANLTEANLTHTQPINAVLHQANLTQATLH